MNSQRGGWWLLLIVAVLTAAGALHLSQRDSPLQSQAIGAGPDRHIVAKLCEARSALVTLRPKGFE
jgi:hypothetical protein